MTARRVTFEFLHNGDIADDDTFIEAIWDVVEKFGGYDQSAASGPA